ncbi:MAG: TonB family protein [Cyanobacteria bacterium SZAS LIN-5]|nr:TonB family protein [Cyanobacteria bacterium SZAS LIN-5]RTL37633.1 MAG: TonB family protein [Candidatus Melainabacteria bacterium]
MADSVSVAEKEMLVPCTKYGAILRAQLKRPDQIKSGRQTLSAAALILLSLTWIGVFVTSGQIHEALAWVCSFSLCVVITLAWLSLSRASHRLSVFRIGENRWATLAGSIATTVAIFSGFLGGWILTHGMPHPEHMEVRRQVVDIVLVSPSDYEDRHDILPSTKPTEQPARDVSVQGRHEVVVPSIKAQPSPLHPVPLLATTTASGAKTFNTPGTFSNQKKDEMAEPAFVVRQQPSPEPASQDKKPVKTSKPKVEATQPVLEEVAPAQLLELTEPNDKASEVSQNGGHSKGGSGSQTLLVTYLRDVHRRIKHAWTPGVDDITGSAQIMFRIRKNGRLVSMKLIRSSGESDTDDSAMHAITACAPFKPLPPEFTADYLDLLYTFNYKVDQLSEVPHAELE